MSCYNYNHTNSVFSVLPMLAAAALLLSHVTCMQAQSAREISERFVDITHGYSITPPAGGKDITGHDQKGLGRWTKTSNKTEKVRWSLSIAITDFKNKVEDVKHYGESIKAYVADKGGVVNSIRQVFLSGRKALMVNGHNTVASLSTVIGKQSIVLLDLQEIWILMPYGQFLIVSLATADDISDAERLKTWQDVIGSIEWIDTKKALKHQEETLLTAHTFLYGDKGNNIPPRFTIDNIRAALPSTPKWFLVYNANNKAIGWICKHGDTARENRETTLRYRTWSMINDTDGEIRLTRFSASIPDKPELTSETWTNTIQVGSGQGAQLIKEHILQEKDTIIRMATVDGKTLPPVQRDIPYKIKRIYLPQIGSALLPGMIKKEGEWTFAEYSSAQNNLVMKRMKIDRKEKIRLDDKAVETLRMIVRTGTASQAVVYWIDQAGQTVKTLNPGGITTRAADKKSVTVIFPKAESLIQDMNRIFSNTK